jgi:predicted amidophosphoribosyltransferase
MIVYRTVKAEMHARANGGLICRSCGKSMAAVKELCDDCQKKGRKSDNPVDDAYGANREAIQARHE